MRISIIALIFWLAASQGSFAQDVDNFLKSSDGELIGTLSLDKTSISITGTIKKLTWTGKTGETIILEWNGIELKGAYGLREKTKNLNSKFDLRRCPFCGLRAYLNSKSMPMWMICENSHEWWALNKTTITIKTP